jgi:hypothetical protein
MTFGLSAAAVAQAPMPAPPVAGPPAGQNVAPDDVSRESRWPLEVETAGEQIIVYQPQLETFQGAKLTARAAVSVQKNNQREPTFGAMWIEARVSTDRVARTVDILDVKVTAAHFPDAEEVSEKVLTDALRSGLAGKPMTVSLDQLLAMLHVVEKEKLADEKLLTQPPKIEFRAHPAVLIQYDGEPRLGKVPDSNLIHVINTPFLAVMDPAANTYYLKGRGQWYSASSALGPFQDAPQVPPEVAAVAEKGGYKDAAEEKAADDEAGLEIVTATEPTELIWTDGPAEMGSIASTDLLYVANTDSDVFLNIATQDLYVLLSGRWYTARHREGPWTFVPPDKLPDDFKRIPPGSEKGDVLAHVAGTEAAQDAILDTFVPQTAAIDRKKAVPPKVEYDGTPKFERVEDTQLTYAVNTDSSVVEVDRRYYCCDNGVWYVSSAATGPWEVCDSVPQAIYTIPPSCPIYPVKYVYVYESTPEVVWCGYTPGYVGCFVYGGAVVFGTGYVYPGWFGAAYYPRPRTFGFSAHYNAYTGNWGFTAGVRGPNGWLAVHGGSAGWWAGGGRTVWAGGGGWWGYGGYRNVGFDRNVNNNFNINRNEVNINRGQINQFNGNVYNRRDDIHRDVARTNIDARGAGTANADRTQLHRPANDVYADREGHVYRKTLDGWEHRDKGQWTPPERPAAQRPTPSDRRGSPEPPAARPGARGGGQEHPNLDRDARARAAGAQRPQTYSPPSRPSMPQGGGRPGGGGRGGRR